MPFHHSDSLRYYTFTSLDEHGLRHAVFTRQGGVSPQPWSGLNVGGTVGDDPARVAENRHRAFRALGRGPASVYDVWQVHGREVAIAGEPRHPDTPHLKADAILSDRPQVTLFMRFADCVPILLYDPRQRVIGLVHAGWQGTVQRVAAAAVVAMQSRYGSRPGEVVAAIGPSIGAHHYEVGPEVAAAVKGAFGLQAEGLLPSCDIPHDKYGQYRVQFDLWKANRLVLEESGVRQIEVAAICTACHLEDWFSHRGEQGRTGRFGVLLAL